MTAFERAWAGAGGMGAVICHASPEFVFAYGPATKTINYGIASAG